MILHLLCMRRNVNRNVFNDRKNVSATTSSLVRNSVTRYEGIISHKRFQKNMLTELLFTILNTTLETKNTDGLPILKNEKNT